MKFIGFEAHYFALMKFAQIIGPLMIAGMIYSNFLQIQSL